ncbi:MAG: hypothetical protein GKS02_06700 [Alphaproteobacteria bacterium]|nr:hypothetical protein [Alphaproteobacteria bacterium]
MILENRALVLDLIEWVAEKPRSYDDVMGAWRTSCPRLPIWEDAVDSGLVVRARDPQTGSSVEITEKGLSVLRQEGRA